MENNAIQNEPGVVKPSTSPTGVKTAPPRVELADEREERRKPKSIPYRILEALASLRLTVVLFVLSLILVFYGTVAQMDKGVWTVVDQYFRSFVVFIPLQLNVQVAQVFFGIPQWVRLPGSLPFPAGWTIGILLLVNLLSAHALRLKFTWARGGVLVLHAGLILLLLGEMATGLFANEGSMRLFNGDSSSFVFDNRRAELAIVIPKNETTEDVVVIPAHMLRTGETINHPDLPFTVVINKYMRNSGTQRANPKANDADSGIGMRKQAVERPEVSGTDPEQMSDTPAAYVKFLHKQSGQSLGTYLLSTLFFDGRLLPVPQQVSVDGKTYDVGLRFKRTYKPYTIKLLKFNHDLYPGTSKPKNFSSDVQLIYPARDEDRPTSISMNSPLRITVDWSGAVPQVDTLFQASFIPGDVGTVLHVVDNPSWLMPYISCTLVTLGMLWHFGFMLPTVLARASLVSRQLRDRKPDLLLPEANSPWLPWIPVAAIALTLGFFGLYALPPRDSGDGPKVQAFGRLPVQDGGRVQPFDSLARNTLMMISDRQEFYEEKIVPGQSPKREEDKEWVKRSAVVWLLDVMSSSVHSNERPYFTVDRELALLIGLQARPDGRFNLADITQGPQSKELAAILNNAKGKKFTELSKIEKQAFDLTATIQRYQQLDRYLTSHRVFRIDSLEVQALLGLERREGHRFAISEFADQLGVLQIENNKAREQERIDKNKLSAYQIQAMKTWDKVGLYMRVADYTKLLVVPPVSKPDEEHWHSLESMPGSDKEEQAANHFLGALRGYFYSKEPKLALDGVDMFNKNVASYETLLADNPVPAAKAIATEQYFNKMAPFYQCLVVYGFVMALVFVGWLLTMAGESLAPWGDSLMRSAFWMMAITVAVHTLALCVRMYLQGRPPVTNLYSSAIFIGWGCVLLGLFLDVVYRTGLGTLVGSALGFLTSIIAFHLSTSGDTLEMMQAVLDTNLWLATHVTTVTLGYTATFVAGGMGMVYLSLWLYGELKADKSLNDAKKTLATMIYGVVCFATLLSFVGTVLGGIWADQSWGRFWGWDPKENGAVLIVIWNALILHARWAGMVKATGMAALTLGGNMITVWSWFGTNQLGVGLHAYGFSNTLALFCVLMWVVHGLMLLTLLIPMTLRLFDVLPKKPA